MNSDYLCRVQNPFIMIDKPKEADEERVVNNVANTLDFTQKN